MTDSLQALSETINTYNLSHAAGLTAEEVQKILEILSGKINCTGEGLQAIIKELEKLNG